MSAITHLTAHGIKMIFDNSSNLAQIMDTFATLQITESKMFAPDEKKGIKQR